jgi:hypothetical protein
MLKQLTAQQIERLASRPGVRRSAVEDFLNTVDANHDAVEARRSLQADARRHGWGAETRGAIEEGIELVTKGFPY